VEFYDIEKELKILSPNNSLENKRISYLKFRLQEMKIELEKSKKDRYNSLKIVDSE